MEDDMDVERHAARLVRLLSSAECIALSEIRHRGGTSCNRPTIEGLVEAGVFVEIPPRSPGEDYRAELTDLGRAVLRLLPERGR